MAESLQTLFGRTYDIMIEQMASFLPKLFAGLVILILGLVIARIVAQVFLAIRLDRLSERLGISAFLARGDVRYTVAEILATVVYWLVLLFSFEILGLVLGLESVVVSSPRFSAICLASWWLRRSWRAEVLSDRFLAAPCKWLRRMPGFPAPVRLVRR